jgi:hypothetical protein
MNTTTDDGIMTPQSASTQRGSRFFERLSSERLFLVILAVALALPLAFSRGKHDEPIVGFPIVTSGDEPHYLVMLHSLLDDGDLDLSNNYDAARRGSIDVGALRAGAPLDHQVAWYAPDGSWHEWDQVFEFAKDPTGPNGLSLMPRLKRGASAEFQTRPQFSQHPVGLPLLLAPLLYPVRGTLWVEHLAILLGTGATFAMALFLRQLFRSISPDNGVVNAATLLAVLGSANWHYGRMLFTEPWLALFAVGALALCTRREAFFSAGCFIALGIQMKPPFALLALPILLDRLLARDFKRSLLFSLPIVGSAALVLLENRFFFGSPFRSAQPWASGNILIGVAGSLFSWDHGLILFCPAVVVAALGWPALLRSHARVGWLSIAMSAPYFLLMSLWKIWWGGYCYGPRLIAPIIPFLFLGAVQVFATLPHRTPGFRRFVAWTCVLSVAISAAGALAHPAFWEKHPLITPLVMLYNHI